MRGDGARLGRRGELGRLDTAGSPAERELSLLLSLRGEDGLRDDGAFSIAGPCSANGLAALLLPTTERAELLGDGVPFVFFAAGDAFASGGRMGFGRGPAEVIGMSIESSK